MDQQEVRELLRKYRLGQCTEAEKTWIENWYNRAAAQSNAELDNLNNQEAKSWQRIRAAMQPENVFQARIRPLRALYWAASIAAMLSLGFFFFYQSKTRTVAENEMVSLVTHSGELATYILPDSSVVTLNAGTSIRYAKVFSGASREIELSDGEAFFDVKHDPSRPFIVNAGRTRTQVLGTAFGIRAYQFLNDVQVTVARGKVGVSNANGFPKSETAFLLPGDKVIVSNKNGHYEKIHADIQTSTGWLKGLLSFDNEDLNTIALLLEKKYNVHVHIVNNELKSQRLTARFKAGETLDEILTTLGVAGNFSFRHASDQVLISMNAH